MLLQALYEYSKTHGNIMPKSCVGKNPKAVVHITADGQLIGVVRREKTADTVICPSVGTAAFGAEKCDPYIANESIILGLDGPDDNIEKWRTKRAFFLNILHETQNDNSDAEAVYMALSDKNSLSQIARELSANKVKPIDMVAFIIDGRSLSDDPRTIAFWHKYWTTSEDDKPHGICMISGENSALATTLKKTTGLAQVGGMPSGDVLTSFDKASFRSYGLDKFQIAPMGQDAADAIVDTLNNMIAEAPQLAGTKYIHWFKEPIPREDDIIENVLGLAFENADDSSDEEQIKVKEREAMAQVNALFEKVTNGEDVSLLQNKYHILILSAYSGRVVIRRYEEGNYGDLVKNVHQWYQDTSIISVSGAGINKHYKMIAMLMGIMGSPNANKVFEQVGKEFAHSLPNIMNTVMNGYPVPHIIVQKALARIRFDLFQDTKKEGDTASAQKASLPMLNARALQWLKAYVVREERKNNNKEDTMTKLNVDHPSPAYHCGRMLAVFGEIQRIAFRDKPVGVTVVEKYYSMMSSNPARVVNNLEQKAQYHMSKIENERIKNNLLNELNAITESVGDAFPTNLNMKERSYFVLGYHHELAELNRQAKEAKDAKKGKYESASPDNNS